MIHGMSMQDGSRNVFSEDNAKVTSLFPMFGREIWILLSVSIKMKLILKFMNVPFSRVFFQYK